MADDFFDKFDKYDTTPIPQSSPVNTEQTAAQNAPQQNTPQQSPPAEPVWQQVYRASQTAPHVGTDSNPYRAPQTTAPPRTGYANPPATNYSRPANTANTFVDADGFYHRSFTEHRPADSADSGKRDAKPEKKQKSHLSTGTVAILLIVCILFAGGAGFGGGYLAMKLSQDKDSTDGNQNIYLDPESSEYDSVNGQVVIHKVDVKETVDSDLVEKDKATDEITREVADSVVEITTEVVQTSGYYGQYISQGAGSGVIISDDGYLVTNNHVIEDASNITVTLRSGESYDATLIGTDSDEDIALLKINAQGMKAATIGDSDTLEVGDKSVIIGNPLGTLGGSVTEGIVSALDRSIVIDGKTMHLMQTDAAINPGNSGGGMFDGQGQLVGIVVAKSSGSTSSGSTIDNIGFVIPINNVVTILSDLKEYGYVRGKVDTGMSFVDITNRMYAWYYYDSNSTGVFISSVERGSNAAEAGFMTGDRVISVDGKSIESVSDLTAIISTYSVGDTISFELERGGRTGSIDLTLEEYVPSSSR